MIIPDKLNEEIGGGRVDVLILLNVGMCELHTVHNAFKAGVKASGWCVEDILSSPLCIGYLQIHLLGSRILWTSRQVIRFHYKHWWLDNVSVVRRAQ